jgi:phosphoribosylformylglycinamidine synthase
MDPQAEAVGESLASLGYRAVTVEGVGRHLSMTVACADEAEARGMADELCEKLLVNPNLETYSLALTRLEVAP